MSKNCEKNMCVSYINLLEKKDEKMNNETTEEINKINQKLKSKNLSTTEINKLKKEKRFLNIFTKKGLKKGKE